jgi:hypothetical protein
VEDADRILRWDIIFPDELTTMFEPSGVAFRVVFSDCGDPVVPSNRVSVGVGGVTVVTGVSMSRDGGVRGRREVSRFGIELV